MEMEPTEIHQQRVVTGDPIAPVDPAPAATVSHVTTTVQSPLYRATQLIWLIVGIINVILAIDFVFRAFKANDVGFADFIYGVGGALASPFDGIFGATITRESYVLRWADPLAIIIYTLVGFALVKIVAITTTPRTRVAP